WSAPRATLNPRATPVAVRDWRLVRSVVRTRGVQLMSATNAAVTAIQTGTLVFLFPLYLAERGGLRPETVGYLVGLGVLGRRIAFVSPRRSFARLFLFLCWLGCAIERCSQGGPFQRLPHGSRRSSPNHWAGEAHPARDRAPR